jgi:branched-chain amino acid transport system substrate-binding protein
MLVLLVHDLHCSQFQSKSDKSVKIGLLIQDNNSRAAKLGAEMAIMKANETGGLNGRPFQLVIRSMEGPWGTGSKQAVDLIFEENVLAIMGSHDGRNAHLVEQVSTKARIVFLSAWSGDPTLAKAFVPWYFSCVPTDIQQADALIDEIYNKRKISKVATISDQGYDSKLAMESFKNQTRSAGKKEPLELICNSDDQQSSVLLDQIVRDSIEGIILFASPGVSLHLIKQIKKMKMSQAVFSNLSLLNEDELPVKDLEYFENVVMLSPEGVSGKNGSSFREEFFKTYGKIPGASAIYSYDGMTLLIKAIKNAGPERENIQKWLSKAHLDGISGAIQFDDKGKRTGIPATVVIKNGLPVRVER